MKATTEKKDLLLDVFLGNGATGVVALDLEHRFVGYENNGDFCRLPEQRMGSLKIPRKYSLYNQHRKAEEYFTLEFSTYIYAKSRMTDEENTLSEG